MWMGIGCVCAKYKKWNIYSPGIPILTHFNGPLHAVQIIPNCKSALFRQKEKKQLLPRIPSEHLIAHKPSNFQRKHPELGHYWIFFVGPHFLI